MNKKWIERLAFVSVIALAIGLFAGPKMLQSQAYFDAFNGWNGLLRGIGVFQKYITVTDSVHTSGDVHANDDILADSQFRGNEYELGEDQADTTGGGLTALVVNKSGYTLEVGRSVVWDATAISVVAKQAIADTLTMANLLSDEGGWYVLSFIWKGTVAADTVTITGTERRGGTSVTYIPADGANATESVPIAESILYNAHFSSLTSIDCSSVDGADSVTVNAYPVMGVVACDGANTDLAGVVYPSTIADNAEGTILLAGAGYCRAIVNCASLAATPGALLEGAATGAFVVDAAATTAQNAATALEYCTSDSSFILVMLDKY